MPNQTKQTAIAISGRARKKRRVNKTWEAFGKYKGAFIVLDPSILD